MAVRQRRMQVRAHLSLGPGAHYSCLAYQHNSQHGHDAEREPQGTCCDNAVTERFFITLKNELIHHPTYHTRDDASRETSAFIEGFYNRQDLHQSLAYLSPLEFEQRISSS